MKISEFQFSTAREARRDYFRDLLSAYADDHRVGCIESEVCLQRLEEQFAPPRLMWLPSVSFIPGCVDLLLNLARRGVNFLVTGFPHDPGNLDVVNTRFLHAFGLHMFTRDESKWDLAIEGARTRPWVVPEALVDRSHPVGRAMTGLPTLVQGVAIAAWGRATAVVRVRASIDQILYGRESAKPYGVSSGEIPVTEGPAVGIVGASSLDGNGQGGRMLVAVALFGEEDMETNEPLARAALSWLTEEWAA